VSALYKPQNISTGGRDTAKSNSKQPISALDKYKDVAPEVKPSPMMSNDFYANKSPEKRDSTCRRSREGTGSSPASRLVRGGYGNYDASQAMKYSSIQHVVQEPYSDDEDTPRAQRGKHSPAKIDKKGLVDLKQAYQSGTLKEQADFRLETMTKTPTMLALIAPYICFALALWLDTNSDFQRTKHALTPFSCGISGSNVTQVDGGYVCKGGVDGVPRLSAFIEIQAVFSYDQHALSQFLDGTNNHYKTYTVPLTIELSGITSTGVEESMYSNSEAPEVEVVCDVTTLTCSAVQLVNLKLDSPGFFGRFAKYSIEIGYQDSLGQFTSGASFVVTYTRELFITILKYIRTSTLVLMLWTILNWLIQVGMEKKISNIWIPERIYFSFLLVSLFLWIDPVLNFVEWKMGNTPHLNYLLLASDLLHAVGTNGLFLTSLLIIDGLGCVRRKKKRYGEDTKLITLQSGRIDLPKHHPCSDYACDFFWTKVIFFVLAVGVSIACSLFKNPGVLLEFWKTESLTSSQKATVLLHWYLCFTLASLILMIAWVLWISRAVVTTGLELKRIPFLDCRFQQLMYRIFTFQLGLVMVCVCLSFGWETYAKLKYLLFNFNLALFMKVWKDQVDNGTDVLWTTTPGELLFLTVSCVTLQYLMLPPSHSIQRRNNRMFIALEDNLPRAHLQLKKRPIFCVETACFLSECAWQVYYEPDHFLDDPLIPGKMDLKPLGLQLVAAFRDDENDTRGFLARSPTRLVLAFRGTLTMKNVRTDLKLAQSSLYDCIDLPDGNTWFDPGELRTSESDTDEDLSRSQRSKKKKGTFCYNCCQRLANAVPCLQSTVPRVHAGFASSYKSIRQHVLAAVQKALREEYAPLYVCGHSLGAGIGALAAYDIATKVGLEMPIVFYSFGMPRIGNRCFSGMFNKKVPHHFRVTVDGDAVPGLPSFFYKHCGTRVLVDADYAGSLIINPNVVERTFGTRGHTDVSVHSLSRYRDCLEAVFEESELKKYLGKGLTNTKGKADPDAVPQWLKEPIARRPRGQCCIVS